MMEEEKKTVVEEKAEELEALPLEEENPEMDRRAKIGWTIFFGVMAALIIACIVVILLLK